MTGMTSAVRSRPALLLFVAGLALLPVAQAQVDYVDPTIGNVGILLEPTRPAAYLPNSMVRMYPIRPDALSDEIQSFPLTISSHRMRELFSIMPGSAAPAAYDQEHPTPYAYSVRFDGSLIQTEFAPTERAGYFHFTFPDGNATVSLSNRLKGRIQAEGTGSTRAVTGVEDFDGMHAFFYGEFSHPVGFKAYDDVHGTRSIASAKNTRVLDFRYGISFISVEQAKANLRREIPAWGLEAVRDAAKARWNQTLGQIEVEGGTDTQKRVFYTALYRSFERMVNITEDGRYYSNFDHQVHTDPRPFYVDNWLWDTYRALEPLQTILNPAMEADKLQSYVRMYQQSGIMPTFATVSGPYACMNGNHAAAWFADAWWKGIRDFNLPTAYEGVKKRSTDVTMLPWSLAPAGPLDTFYREHGYMPALHPGEPETVPGVSPGEKRQPVPVTLGNSFDEWNIANIARVLNRPEDQAFYMKRAANWQNVFRVDKGMMWPKDAGGRWIDIDPKFDGGMGARDFYDENNGYTYTWDVAHDFNGLFTLMGGTDKAQASLDQLFREPLGRSKYAFQAKLPDSTSMAGQFSMGNEPSFAIPYLYNRLGAPWKTQKRVRMLLDSFFPATLTGIPGDEDGGGMSAFVVFSMMGFYPVTVGMPVYDIGSPVFTRVTIHLKNGHDFVIHAPGSSRDIKYVTAIKLNGTSSDHVWFRHSDLVSGGTLDLTMSDTPNPTLGAQPASFPPDSITVNPADYAAR